MNWRILIVVMLAAFAVAGCDRIEVISKQSRGEGGDESKGAAAQKVDAPASGDAQTTSEDSQHNALLENEDASSRERRNRARASLGLGGK